MDRKPTQEDLEAAFKILRAVPSNKTCFDCGAKNPTWASVTYGVFICIDCSAVHRSLGVHLSFVRSTQLDTNWTRVQLRQMQLGGNAKALQFFTQHNCSTSDAQKKYNSRAARLYRDELQRLAVIALSDQMQIDQYLFFGKKNQLPINPHIEEKPTEKEPDFFSEHENFDVPEALTNLKLEDDKQGNAVPVLQPGDGPKVDFSLNSAANEPRKSVIAARKPQAKKSSLGAKKGGLGATRVKTNFADLEKEAALAETSRLRAQEESARVAALTAQQQEEQEAAMRLAYKDLSTQQQKTEEQLKRMDPKKAEQVERLGMGFSANKGISHSVLSDMKTIEQENVQSTPSSLSTIGKLRTNDDSFFDDYSFGSSFSMNRNTYGSNKLDALISESSSRSSSKDQWVIIDDPGSDSAKGAKPKEKATLQSMPSTSDEAQKKFGSAKAISSDQFFNDNKIDYETQANLNRFQGSSSISSSDFFGTGNNNSDSSRPLQNYDLEDVKESVRMGVRSIAERMSTIAGGVMSSLQERYGY